MGQGGYEQVAVIVREAVQYDESHRSAGDDKILLIAARLIPIAAQKAIAAVRILIFGCFDIGKPPGCP